MWFLKHEHFQKWLLQDSGPLLVSADPGCGKSVLAKYLIDEGLPRSWTICYFFFKDQDQNTTRQARCAVLHQLFCKRPPLIQHAMELYKQRGDRLVTSTESLWQIFRNAVKDCREEPITVVLDALDECSETDFADLMRNLKSQFDNRSSLSKLKFILTSRPYSQIISKFRDLLKAFPNIHIPGEDESEIISQEINHVIERRVDFFPHELSPQLKDHLKQKLKEITHRTYLWAYLVFDYLEHGDFIRTPKGVEAAIASLPRSVSEAYEQILNKSKDQRIVRKVLRIVLAASRPLKVSEMNIAVHIEQNTQTMCDLDLEGDQDFEQRLRSCCGLFVAIHLGKIYFLHQTAREFLLADASSPEISAAAHWRCSFSPKNAHRVLSDICVDYLSLFNSEPPMAGTDAAGHSVEGNAFLNYAAKHWVGHFLEADVDEYDAVANLAFKICNPSSKSCLKWNKIFFQDYYYDDLPYLTDLIVASFRGLVVIAKLALQGGAELDAGMIYITTRR